MAPRECGICWYVYQPAQGDDVWQVPPGTPFEALPDDWRCPRCDSAKDRFLPLREAPVDPRVRALEEAYRKIERERMSDFPLLNPALKVQAVGFRAFEGGLLGALVTPWSLNAIYFPPGGPPAPELGHDRALPAGPCRFFAQQVHGVEPIELASIVSPAVDFASQDEAVAAAGAAIDALLSPPPPPPKPAASRRELFPFLSRGPR